MVEALAPEPLAGRDVGHQAVEGTAGRWLDAGDAVRIDGSGKTLMPGLWDMHGHLSLSDGVLNVAGGVVNVRDIGNEHEQIMDVVQKFDSGEVIGPNVFRAGFMDRTISVAATMETSATRSASQPSRSAALSSATFSSWATSTARP